MADGRRALVPGADVHTLHLDLAELSSVRDCASAWLDSGRPLDVLLNNAGAHALGVPLSNAGAHALGVPLSNAGAYALGVLLRAVGAMTCRGLPQAMWGSRAAVPRQHAGEPRLHVGMQAWVCL